jgi:hypothetical protein
MNLTKIEKRMGTAAHGYWKSELRVLDAVWLTDFRCRWSAGRFVERRVVLVSPAVRWW